MMKVSSLTHPWPLPSAPTSDFAADASGFDGLEVAGRVQFGVAGPSEASTSAEFTANAPDLFATLMKRFFASIVFN